ncbi:MAG: hypothetical protein JHC94_05550 [Acidimicrobiia bacterium]|nr:hypothetical protein [Acidimicrobiia bacterium]
MREQSTLPSDLAIPAASRLRPDNYDYEVICAAHSAALQHAQSGYIDPVSGLFVMTAGYLWSQGSCCEKGCRHCPYIER